MTIDHWVNVLCYLGIIWLVLDSNLANMTNFTLSRLMYEWMFLILFDIINLWYFLQNRTIFFAVRQAFARFCHGFFQVWGKCCSKQFPTQKGVSVLVYPMIFIGYIDIILSILADIMPFFVVLNSLTDVIIKVCVNCFTTLGRCYCHMWDGIATLDVNYVWLFCMNCRYYSNLLYWWQMLLPIFFFVSGRW